MILKFNLFNLIWLMKVTLWQVWFLTVVCLKIYSQVSTFDPWNLTLPCIDVWPYNDLVRVLFSTVLGSGFFLFLTCSVSCLFCCLSLVSGSKHRFFWGASWNFAVAQNTLSSFGGAFVYPVLMMLKKCQNLLVGLCGIPGSRTSPHFKSTWFDKKIIIIIFFVIEFCRVIPRKNSLA